MQGHLLPEAKLLDNHSAQHAYMAELAMGVFVDFEGAFSNTPFGAMTEALVE